MTKSKGNLLKILTSIVVLIAFFSFLNDTAYNSFKRLLVKNSKLYTEMVAYGKSKGNTEKFFIIQDKPYVSSLVERELKILPEEKLNDLGCSEQETYLIFEEETKDILDYATKYQAEILVLNSGTDIQFYVLKVLGRESCQIE